MIEKFKNYMVADQLICRNDRIVVAVSGGPDSMALLHLLYTIKEDYNLEIFVAHIEHQFRGQDSIDDMNFVIDYCRSLGVKCYSKSINVAQLASDTGQSFEEAGRQVRYQLFQEVLEKERCHKIAVAQNLDDQAETVLMRLFRGAGLDGLSGIKLIRNDVVIRPLMRFMKSEILDYCEKHNLEPRIDKTNLESIYTRNKIRLDLIPYLEANFNPNIKKTLARTAEILGDDLNYINGQVDEKWLELFYKNGAGFAVKLENYNRLHVCIRKRLIRKALLIVAGNLKDVSSGQIEQIDRICSEERTNKAVVVDDIEFRIDYDVLSVKRKIYEPSPSFYQIVKINDLMNKGVSLESSLYGSMRAVCLAVEDVDSWQHEPEEIVAYFDWKYAKEDLIIRSRKAGDWFYPKGMNGRKKIKDYFIDCKIKKEERNHIPLVVVNEEIIWVVGHRQSERGKVSKNADKVLVLVATKR